jgi:hypothetical protein
MTAGAFLPVTIYKNKLFFLFGKESRNDETPGFSDFGGGIEKNEYIYEGALREFAEETSGFFGDKEDIRMMVEKNGGYLKFTNDTYHTHIVKLDYDGKLLKYYNNFQRFLNKTIKNNNNWIKMIKMTKIFEKEKMEWMTKEDIMARINEFRPFYRDIIKNILKNYSKIFKFIKKNGNRNYTHNKKTLKNKSYKNHTKNSLQK